MTKIFELNERTKAVMPLATLLCFLTATATAAITYESMRSADQSNTAAIQELQARMIKLEKTQEDIAVLKNDVQWLRRYLESQRK
jgi:hypothetical protein